MKYIEELSQSEAAGIKKRYRICFARPVFAGKMMTRVTLVQRDNPRYRICANHREFISDYLSVLDCELVHDPQEHIFAFGERVCQSTV